MKNNLIYAGISVAIACAVGGIIYGVYLFKKSIAYDLFYDDRVRETIAEMVKQSCLN